MGSFEKKFFVNIFGYSCRSRLVVTLSVASACLKPWAVHITGSSNCKPDSCNLRCGQLRMVAKDRHRLRWWLYPAQSCDVHSGKIYKLVCPKLLSLMFGCAFFSKPDSVECELCKLYACKAWSEAELELKKKKFLWMYKTVTSYPATVCAHMLLVCWDVCFVCKNFDSCSWLNCP